MSKPHLGDGSDPHRSDQHRRSPADGCAPDISHRRDDARASAGRLDETLARELDPDRWFEDVDSIALGKDLRAETAQALTECGVTVAVFDERSLDFGSHELSIEHQFDSLIVVNRPLHPAAVYGSALREPGTLDAAAAAAALGDVRVLRGWLDAYEARVMRRIDELSAVGESVPAADLHTRDGGVSSKEAQQKERRAKVLDDAPALADKLAAGEVTAGHADALANATIRCDDETKHELFGLQADLAADASRMSPEEFAKNCRDLVQRLERDQGVERDRQLRRETRVTKTVGRDGMYVLNARLHPELGNVVFNAIDAETARLVTAGGDRSVDRSHVAAEALGNLVTSGHQSQRPAEAEIRVHIAADRLVDESATEGCCEFDDGQPVPPTTVRRLLCNGRIVPIIVESNGVVLNAGREQRLANRHQRRALRAMYRTCAFPGCDVNFNRCEIHHIVEFELGGRTDLAKLLPLCCRHHHLVHEMGLRLSLDDNRTLTIHQRDGTLYAEQRLRPPPALRSTEPPSATSTGPPGGASAESDERQLSLIA